MLINVITKNFNKIKTRNFGIGKKFFCHSTQKFGLPRLTNTFLFSSNLLKVYYNNDTLIKVNKSLTNFTLSNSSDFNLSLRRLLSKRIRLFKFNRSLRGFRHDQGLPVRGQRSKTNARTQKSRRKKK